MFAVVPLVIPKTLSLVLFGLIVLSLVFIVLPMRRQSVVMLHLGARGELEIERKVGVRETANIEPHTAILPGLIVLLLHCGADRIALPLLADALDSQLNRQLRLWLQWRGKA